MTPAVALRLGRISNLPTVWTNVLAGMVLAGALPDGEVVLAITLAMSLFYGGGMYLNDAFDVAWDAVERPERPIPSRQAAVRSIFLAGFGMLTAGTVILAWMAPSLAGGWRLTASGGGLAAAIVLYDWHHKGNPWSPLLMGLCRALVYVTAAYGVVALLPAKVLAAAFVLTCYVAGLTYAAKFEAGGRVGPPWPLLLLVIPAAYGLGLNYHQPLGLLFQLGFAGWMLHGVRLLQRGGKDIPRAVAALIAGISLLDAALIASQGAFALAGLAAAAFALTVGLQRRIPGT